MVAIYRLTFHPLAKYPGPLLDRITQWPEAISAWRLSRHLDLDRLHERYGMSCQILLFGLCYSLRHTNVH